MKRVIEIEKEYKATPKKAIEKFFKKFPEINYWKETFEWMLESGTEHFTDDMMADGTKNNEWCYSLWLDQNDDYTYICVIERA